MFYWIVILLPAVDGSLALWPWKLVPRLTDRGIPSVPIQTDRKDSLLQCAMNCHLREECAMFLFNLLTLTCDLYDRGDYSPNSDVPGNRFYQMMPHDCVSGRDEWFPQYEACVWFYRGYLVHEDAKQMCESEGKTMMAAKNVTQIQHLMTVAGFRWIHVNSRWVGTNAYEWPDGSPISASGWWCPYQPGEGTGCLGVDWSRFSWCPDGGLDDIFCSTTNQFICV